MSRKQYADLDMLGVSRILDLPAPLANAEPATKIYVDSAVEGLNWKDNCRVGTSSNINLASPGATLDGIAMSASDRVLVRGQTASAENGIYVWNGAAVAMTRSPDANTAEELEQATTSVDEGTDANTSWRQTAVNFVLDTDPVVWVSFGTSAPPASETTAGIAEIATQAETNAGTDDQRIVTPLKLANWTGGGGGASFQQDFGDGAATQYDITHSLGTQDLQVTVRRVASPYDEVDCEVEHLDANTTRLRFTVAPTSNQFRAVING